MERGGYPLYQLPGVLVFRQQTLDNIYYTTCILYTAALYTTVPINSTLLQYILYNVLQCPPYHYTVYYIHHCTPQHYTVQCALQSTSLERWPLSIQEVSWSSQAPQTMSAELNTQNSRPYFKSGLAGLSFISYIIVIK